MAEVTEIMNTLGSQISMIESVLVFIIFFLFLSNWFQILTIFGALFNGKIERKQINDKWVNNTVFKKTGLKLLGITFFNDKKMYGMMMGLPFWPKMVLSKGLYNNLNRDELEWVILHEAGHCVLWHNLKAMLYEVLLMIVGIVLITTNQLNIFISLFVAFILSLICVQIMRWLIEYEADKFSIERVNNPNGVITAQGKFRSARYKNYFSNEKSLGRILLHWNILPSKRIEMAKTRLS